MDLEQIVINNIKKYRKLKNLSQEKLAEKCNTATSYIGLVEIGRKIPKISTVEKIAKALEIKPQLLFADDEGFEKAKINAVLNQIKDILEK